MIKNKTALAILAALAAQVIFGFSFMFTKIALGFASPLVVIANRYMVAFLVMTVVMLAAKQKFKIGKNIWKLVAMSFFQPVLYFLFEGYGISLSTSSFSSVMISLIPVVSMLCGIWFLSEKPVFMQYVFTALSVAGVIIMAFAGKREGTVTVAGILLLLGAVLSSVAYNITSRKISSEFSVFERTYAMMAIGLVAFLFIALSANHGTPEKLITSFASYRYTASILYLAVLSSVAAFMLLNFANTYLPVAKTTAFSNITTVVSVVAGVVFLNETFSLREAVATLMIIFGVFGVQMMGVKQR